MLDPVDELEHAVDLGLSVLHSARCYRGRDVVREPERTWRRALDTTLTPHALRVVTIPSAIAEDGALRRSVEIEDEAKSPGPVPLSIEPIAATRLHERVRSRRGALARERGRGARVRSARRHAPLRGGANNAVFWTAEANSGPWTLTLQQAWVPCRHSPFRPTSRSDELILGNLPPEGREGTVAPDWTNLPSARVGRPGWHRSTVLFTRDGRAPRPPVQSHSRRTAWNYPWSRDSPCQDSPL